MKYRIYTPWTGCLRALVLSTSLTFATAAAAQVVNDGATVTLVNVTNSITGTVTVGTNGAFATRVSADVRGISATFVEDAR